MGGFILKHNTNITKQKIYVLNAHNCLNFNKTENQKFAQKVNIPYELLIQKEHIRIILQWYIYVRNFGCVQYNNKTFNLNLSSEAHELLSILKNENFLRFLDENTVEVIDPEFKYIGIVKIPFLWINLLHKKLPELTDEQIEIYNLNVSNSISKEGTNNVL